MLVETYDHVVHGQRHFRAILYALSRPGTIVDLETVTCRPSAQLSVATAFVALALFDANVRFHLVNMTEHDEAYLTANTGARTSRIEQADFVVCRGLEPTGALDSVNCGSLTYPDTAATILLQIESLSTQPLPGGLTLTVEGPGVGPLRRRVSARGLEPDVLLALQARNTEFPLGLDTLMTAVDARDGVARVCGLPRTSRFAFTRN